MDIEIGNWDRDGTALDIFNESAGQSDRSFRKLKGIAEGKIGQYMGGK